MLTRPPASSVVPSRPGDGTPSFLGTGMRRLLTRRDQGLPEPMVSSEDTGAEHDDQHDAQGEPDRHVPGASGRRLASRNDDLPRGLSCPPPNGPTVAPTTCDRDVHHLRAGPARREARRAAASPRHPGWPGGDAGAAIRTGRGSFSGSLGPRPSARSSRKCRQLRRRISVGSEPGSSARAALLLSHMKSNGATGHDPRGQDESSRPTQPGQAIPRSARPAAVRPLFPVLALISLYGEGSPAAYERGRAAPMDRAAPPA
jgi:hypothetical protein